MCLDRKQTITRPRTCVEVREMLATNDHYTGSDNSVLLSKSYLAGILGKRSSRLAYRVLFKSRGTDRRYLTGVDPDSESLSRMLLYAATMRSDRCCRVTSDDGLKRSCQVSSIPRSSFQKVKFELQTLFLCTSNCSSTVYPCLYCSFDISTKPPPHHHPDIPSHTNNPIPAKPSAQSQATSPPHEAPLNTR